jgi:hypothetical protein
MTRRGFVGWLGLLIVATLLPVAAPLYAADVTIEASLIAANTSTRWTNALVWTTKDVGYAFFLNSASPQAVQYRKTTDGGATWAAAVTVFNANDAQQFCIWYGKWNTSNAIIHIWYNDTRDQISHKTLDPSSDTLSSEHVVATAFATGATTGWVTAQMTGTRTLGGNLLVTGKVDNGGASGAFSIRRSVDEGVNWTSRATSFETSTDEVMLLPANAADQQDAYLLYGDASADELSVKFYDDSANTVGSETTISGAGGYVEAGANYLNWDAMYYNGVIYVVWCDLHNSASANLKASSFTANTATPTVNAKANVLSSTQAVVSPRLYINALTGDVYVFYLRGTLGSSMHAYYKKSSDGMTSWGTEVQYDEGTAAGFQIIDSGRLAHAVDGGRISVTWRHDTNDDLLINKVNSIEVTTTTGCTTRGLLLTGAGC